MLSRMLAASVLPRGGWPRSLRPGWRATLVMLANSRRRSLQIQERVERARARHIERHASGVHGPRSLR